MFSNSEWIALISKLSELTDEGLLKWISRNGLLLTNVNGTDYAIGAVDNDDRPPYFLDVGDAEARENLARLESIPSEDDEWEGEENASQMIWALRGKALRSATGAPQLIRRLLGDLEELADIARER